MKCKNCNVEISEGGSACPICGKSLMELASAGLIEKDVVNQGGVGEETFTMPVVDESNKVETFEQPENKAVVESVQTSAQTVQVQADPVKEEVFTTEAGSSTIETFNPVEAGGKKKKSIVPIIGVLAAVVLILGAGFLVYLKFTPKLAFKSVIDQSLKQFEKGIGLDYDTMKADFDVNIKMSGKAEDAEMFDIINKLGLSGIVEADYKNNKAFVKLNTTYDKEELLNADVFYDKNEAFVQLNNLYDKYIKYDFEGIEIEKPLTEDYNVITETFIKELEKNLKLEYFKKSNDGEYNKNTLELTYKQANDIARKIVTELKDDDKFMSSLANVSKEDKDQLKKSFEDLLKEEDESKDNDDEIALTIDLYTEKFSNKVKKIEVDIEEVKFVVEFEDENSVLFKVISDNETMSYIVTTSKDGDKDKLTMTLAYDEYSIEIDFIYSIKYNEKITEPDVGNSVDYNSMTEEDSNKIMDNLMKNSGVSKFLEDTGLGALLYGGLGNDNYGYGYDDYQNDYGASLDSFGNQDKIS